MGGKSLVVFVLRCDKDRKGRDGRHDRGVDGGGKVFIGCRVQGESQKEGGEQEEKKGSMS